MGTNGTHRRHLLYNDTKLLYKEKPCVCVYACWHLHYIVFDPLLVCRWSVSFDIVIFINVKPSYIIYFCPTSEALINCRSTICHKPINATRFCYRRLQQPHWREFHTQTHKEISARLESDMRSLWPFKGIHCSASNCVEHHTHKLIDDPFIDH